MPGLTLKTNQEIYKGDIVVLCKCLNEEFKGSCEFEPEGISEGGILYKFKDGTPGYKSVRLDRNAGKWVRPHLLLMNYRYGKSVLIKLVSKK